MPDGPQPPDQYPAGPRPRPTWARWAHAPAALSPGCEDGRRCPSHRPVEAPPPATPPPPGGRGSWPGGSEGWVPPPLPGPVDPRFLTCQVRVMTEAPVGGGTPKLLGLVHPGAWRRENKRQIQYAWKLISFSDAREQKQVKILWQKPHIVFEQ